MRVWKHRLVCKNAGLIATALLTLFSPLYMVLGSLPTVHAASPISSSDVQVNEADQTATFTFTLNGSTETQYTYQTVEGTATAPEDYSASSGTLQFNTDTTDLPTTTVSVPITDDQLFESTESFTIEVYSNIDGPVLEGSWTGTIIDDDPEVVPPQNPVIASSDVEVNEADKTATFTFTIVGFPEFDYTYKTVDGTAIAPDDYTTTTGTLLFDNNETRIHSATVVVPITNDNTPESTESFTIEVYSNIDGPVLEGSWTGTIIDDDPIVITPPVDVPPQVPPTIPPTTPTNVTSTPQPTSVAIINPVLIPKPIFTPVLASIVTEPEPTIEQQPPVTEKPQVLPATTPTPVVPPTQTNPLKGPERAAFVKSVTDPSQLPTDFTTIAKTLLLAGFLVLLIFFPADLFNATLQDNYDEVAGWFRLTRLRQLHERLKLHTVPIALSVAIYAALAALLNSQLSPDFGWNRASLALVIGMFLALILSATVYDLIRARYLKRRYSKTSRLRTHVIGLTTGGILVMISRMANFLPGYLYGLFTGLVFQEEPTDEQDGEGLAVASVALLILAIGGWFALVPVRQAVVRSNAGFPLLVLEAALATLWVSTLGAIVFGLIPLRYLYGEALKKWSKLGWTLIYGAGMTLFVYTLLDPSQSFYGKSDKVSLVSVLSLFFGFGIFSVLFWGYFRFRPVRLQPTPKKVT